MATQKLKSNINQSNSVRVAKKRQKVTRLQGLIVALLLAVIGVVVVALTHASTSAGTVATGNANFTSSLTTTSVKSSDGWLCVATTFNDNAPLFVTSYKWEVQLYKGYQWATIITSQSFGANNNRDHACYDANIYKGNIYRVVFKKASSDGISNISGGYYVSGFYRN